MTSQAGELTREAICYWWQTSGSFSSDPIVERIVATALAHIDALQADAASKQTVALMWDQVAKAAQPETPVPLHHYHPSTLHMGDCSVCGNIASSPLHIAAVPLQDRFNVARQKFSECFDSIPPEASWLKEIIANLFDLKSPCLPLQEEREAKHPDDCRCPNCWDYPAAPSPAPGDEKAKRRTGAVDGIPQVGDLMERLANMQLHCGWGLRTEAANSIRALRNANAALTDANERLKGALTHIRDCFWRDNEPYQERLGYLQFHARAALDGVSR